MTTFFFFGSYTNTALEGIDARRTKQAEETIKGFGGKLRSVYALLGQHDIVMIAELPGVAEALQVSIALTQKTKIQFTSYPAVPVVDFDRLAADLLGGA
ncbi:MAG: GYD domain-containing protein [Spirochaetota bacterium]